MELMPSGACLETPHIPMGQKQGQLIKYKAHLPFTHDLLPQQGSTC